MYIRNRRQNRGKFEELVYHIFGLLYGVAGLLVRTAIERFWNGFPDIQVQVETYLEVFTDFVKYTVRSQITSIVVDFALYLS